MSSPTLPAMKTSPKFVFFTDFDGTITMSDSNDFMTDTIGFGQVKRKEQNRAVLEGRTTFRDSFKEMMDSVTRPYDECIKYLVDHVELDPYFTEFFQWASENNIPVVVLSSGMEPIIKAILAATIGPAAENLQVVANTIRARPGKTINEEGGWELTFHDDSGFGHDKSLTLRPYAQLPEDQRPVMFYAGDGVSDLSAARETDLLFAKKGHDLVTYCVREGIPFTLFESWKSIMEKTKAIVAGQISVKDAAAQGVSEYLAEQKA